MNNKTRPIPNDWRRQGQEKYLKGTKIFSRDYLHHRLEWDHDHCEFCGTKFSMNQNDLKKGYSTDDGYHWICCQCFNDFQYEFNWQVVNDLCNENKLES